MLINFLPHELLFKVNSSAKITKLIMACTNLCGVSLATIHNAFESVGISVFNS